LAAAPPVADKPNPARKTLKQVVLGISDLPDGWSSQSPDPGAAVICNGRAPATVLTPSDAEVRSFSQSAAGPFLTNVAEQFANVELAKQFMDLTAETADTCRSYEVNGSKIRLGALDFPEFGDETFAVRATGSSPLGALDGALVFVRKGSRVASLQTIAFGGSPVNQNLLAFLTRGLAARL
jgi:hypothetical protein